VSQPDREIEVKLRFERPEDAAAKLRELGADETVPRLFEDNVLFDRVDDPLHAGGKALRLRRVGGRAIVTYKGPVEGTHRHKVRIEHETAVADGDSAERILLALGYAPHWRYQKYRTEFGFDGLHICLDESPLGCYVELEGAPDAIDRTAARLGFSVDDYVTDSYRKLLETEAAKCGREPWDLVFDAEDVAR
jgi:adenylate cyclase class 2